MALNRSVIAMAVILDQKGNPPPLRKHALSSFLFLHQNTSSPTITTSLSPSKHTGICHYSKSDKGDSITNVKSKRHTCRSTMARSAPRPGLGFHIKPIVIVVAIVKLPFRSVYVKAFPKSPLLQKPPLISFPFLYLSLSPSPTAKVAVLNILIRTI